MNSNLGIYIHIPFCKKRCYYCDFYSCTNCSENQIEKYVDALCHEILLNTELLQERVIDTIYIGGGTPSFIDSKYIVKILDTLKLFPHNLKEVTIEVNPDSVTYENLNDYLKAGINRISIGLQSANETTLKNIGRTHDRVTFEKAYDLIKKAGFTNISVDIITGLVNESLEDFRNTLQFVTKIHDISHISCYSLELHENTKLAFLVKNNFLTLPQDFEERNMKYLADEVLLKNGFERYEISNYAKASKYSIHNLKYWNQEEYLGFGASASSFINSTRYTNTRDTDTYINNINNGISNICEIEEMSYEELMKEYIILRLRLKDGVIFKDFKDKFKVNFLNLYNDKVEKLLIQKLIVKTNDNIYLSDKGEDVANIVWQEFI